MYIHIHVHVHLFTYIYIHMYTIIYMSLCVYEFSWDSLSSVEQQLMKIRCMGLLP